MSMPRSKSAPSDSLLCASASRAADNQSASVPASAREAAIRAALGDTVKSGGLLLIVAGSVPIR